MALQLCGRAEFMEAPAGRFMRGRGWIFFSIRDDLYGYALFGTTEAGGIRELVELMEMLGQHFDDRPERTPHYFVAHIGRLTTVDPGAFSALAEFINRNDNKLGERVIQAAIVRPDAGVLASVVEGFFPVVGAPFPLTLHTDMHAALRELGHGDETSAAEIEAALDQTASEPAYLSVLRSYLRSQLLDPDVGRVAASCGMSVRSLQRRLTDSNTTFGAEVLEARLDAARTRLASNTLSITEIAYEVGFSSPQHLSRHFRVRFGTSPSEFRHRVAAKDPSDGSPDAR